MLQPVDYLSPDVPGQLPWHDVPLIVATDESVSEYGQLVENPEDFDIEIVQWPANGWRPIDAGTGDEGGVVEGIFHSEWRGDFLHGRNDAVNGHYILGWSANPASAKADASVTEPERVLLWHLNYPPDGGNYFTRWIISRLWCRWRNQVTTSGWKTSLPSGVTAVRECIFIRVSGTRVFFRRPPRSRFVIDRAECMHG